MSRWIRTEYVFEPRSALFVVTRRATQSWWREFVSTCEKFSDDPELLEDVLRKMVLHYRPELQGCVLWGIGYIYQTGEVEIVVYHSSLPRTPPENKLKKFHLDPKLEEESPYESK